MKVRVINVSNQNPDTPRGKFLDAPGKGPDKSDLFIGAGRHVVLDVDIKMLPDWLQVWVDAKDVKLQSIDGRETFFTPPMGHISPGTVAPIHEARGDEDLDEFNFDPGDAIEAALPKRAEYTGPMTPDTRQHRAHIGDAVNAAPQRVQGGGDALSPIPGDRPRSIDNSEQFTIKAPRAQGVGRVIGK